MGMNQPSPEILQQLMAQSQSNQLQGTDPSQGQIDQMSQIAATGGHPMVGIQSPPTLNNPPQIDPMEILPEVISQYMNYALGIIKDGTLDKPVQSKILLEQAQAISTLVSSIQNQNQVDPAQQQAEMAMKQAQHTQDLQMKHEAHQAMIGQQQEKHQMEIQKMNHEMQLALAKHEMDKITAVQKMEHQQQTHEQKLVHNEKNQQNKAQQAKQPSQSKQSSNHSKK